MLKAPLKMLSASLKSLGRAIQKRGQYDMSLDACIVLDADKSPPVVRAWTPRAEISAEAEIPGGEGKGAIAVSMGAKFKTFIAEAAKGAAADDSIAITCDGGEVVNIELPGGKSGMLPAASDALSSDKAGRYKMPARAPKATIRRDSLLAALDACAAFMAGDDARYYLEGLLIELGSGENRAIATNGHCLAVHDIEAITPHPFALILPRNLVKLLHAAAKKKSAAEVAYMRSHKGIVSITLGAITWTTRQIGARKYPDYRRILDGSKAAPAIRISPPVLRDLAARAVSLGIETLELRPEREAGKLKIRGNGGEAEISDSAGELIAGGPESWVHSKDRPEPTADEIHFDPAYLRLAAERLPGDSAEIEIESACTLARFTAPGFILAVMPKMP